MTEQRFVDVQKCTRGFGMDGRSGFDETNVWIGRGQILGHDLEACIFQRSVEILLNRQNGAIVVDDELIASRASDLECKIVSPRKKGKEGPVTDNVACSVSSALFGMRLRKKRCSQEENVQELLNRLPQPA